MHRRVALLLFSTCSFQALSSEPPAVDAARQAALAWIKLLDSLDSASAWDQAASGFKKAVTTQQWAQAASSVRGPLGFARQREERGAQFTKTLPGAPDAEYVVFQFQTVFENKASAVETVTVVKDNDGFWRVTGYFIK